MFPYDAVLFDLDGTLTESAPGIMRSAGYAARKLGYVDFDPQVLRRFIGPPLFESFQKIFGMDEAQALKVVELYREDFDAVGWSVNAVYEGIPMLLRALKRAGIKICLATAKPMVFAERILRHFGLWRFFDVAIGITLEDHHADKAKLVRAATPAGCERPVLRRRRRPRQRHGYHRRAVRLWEPGGAGSGRRNAHRGQRGGAVGHPAARRGP